jgi:hypothetical protein
MNEQSAILTATTAYDRNAAIAAARHNPFVTMIGQSWAGARLLIRTQDGENLEHVVSGIKSHVERASGIRYRRDA